MSKTTTTIYINLDGNGGVNFTQNGKAPGVLEISDDVNLAIDCGTGFTGNNAKVTSMELYQDDNGTKGTPIGTWLRTSPTGQPNGAVAITANGKNILVDDTNTTGADESFFFSVSATDGTRSYSSDPELKVKRKLGTR